MQGETGVGRTQGYGAEETKKSRSSRAFKCVCFRSDTSEKKIIPHSR